MKLRTILEEFKDYERETKTAIYKNPNSKDFLLMDQESSKYVKGTYRVVLDLKNKIAYFAIADIYHVQMAKTLNLPGNYNDSSSILHKDYVYASVKRNKNKLIESMDSFDDYDTLTEKERKALVDFRENVVRNKEFIDRWISYDQLLNKIVNKMRMANIKIPKEEIKI